MSRFFTTTGLAALVAGAGLGASSVAQQTPPQTQEVLVDAGERVVVTGMVPIPDIGEGAPRFTSKDVKEIEEAARNVAANSQRDIRRCKPPDKEAAPCKPAGSFQEVLSCEAEYATQAANLAGKAVNASAAAEDVRRAAAAGQADMQAVAAAELARQDAVNKMQEARQKLVETQARLADMQKVMTGFQGWDPNHQEMKRRKAGWGLGVALPNVPEGLSIINVKVVQYSDAKGEFARIQGDIVNSGKKPTKIPGLAATLIDEKGFPLNTTSVAPSNKGSIPAGKTRPFQFDMRPAPDLTRTAIVTFAPDGAPPPRIRMNGLLCPRD